VGGNERDLIIKAAVGANRETEIWVYSDGLQSLMGGKGGSGADKGRTENARDWEVSNKKGSGGVHRCCAPTRKPVGMHELKKTRAEKAGKDFGGSVR